MFATGLTTAGFDIRDARGTGARGVVCANTQWWRGSWRRFSARLFRLSA